MHTRRSFFQCLAATPLALIGVSLASRKVPLPIGCDLSMNSLQWAIEEGRRLRFGKALTLKIGPENLFPARALLGRPPQPYKDSPFKRGDFFVYEITRDLPMNTWRVEFEHGVVESQGPC